MTNYKANRFLIDEIDKRLGSLDKELKFDKIMIAIGVFLIVVPTILVQFTAEKSPKLSVFLLMLALVGIGIATTMVKEYLNDLKRKK
jgi:hypothetical protein